MILKMAFRNIFRHRIRSVLTLSSLAFGIFFIIVGIGLNIGMERRIIKIMRETETGDYKVEITNGACVNTSGCKSVIVIGIINVNNTLEGNLFPNPAKNEITFSTSITGEFEAAIHSIDGVLVKTVSIQGNDSINIEDLEAGTYIISIKNNISQTSYKLIKE